MVQQRARVLVTEAIHPIGVEVLAREVEVVNLPERPGETVAQHLPIVDGVLVRTARLTAPLLETAPGLKIIGKVSTISTSPRRGDWGFRSCRRRARMRRPSPSTRSP